MRWLTGDLHLFHKNILHYCRRPFPDVRSMNDALIQNWNERVSREDEVYVLGDFAFTRDHEATVKEIFALLKGRKTLLKGNHDKSVVCALPWEKVVTTGGLEVDGVLLVHDGGDLLNHTLRDYADRPIFQAHVHEVWKQRANRLNCGVDVWHFRPVEFQDALSYWRHRFEYWKATGQDA